jgi:hypothetical protein
LSNFDEISLSFPESVTINGVAQAWVDISAAFAQGMPIVVDIDAVTETDLTFVQLIEAARRKADETGCNLTLRHPAAGAVLEVLRRGGFLGDDHSDRAKFWLQGAAQ